MVAARFVTGRRKIGKLALLAALALGWGCRPAAAQQGEPPPPLIKPVISFNVLMVRFVDQAADAIWTAAVHPPKRNCEWDQVEYRATQLATTGTLLRIGGTGPLDMQWKDSAHWAAFADKMSELALAASQAAHAHDVGRIKTVGDQLILNCEACHREFKPEIPTQSIVTHLSHAVPLAEDLPPNCRRRS